MSDDAAVVDLQRQVIDRLLRDADRLRTENATLRELVREVLVWEEYGTPEWRDRAEKALAG
jgi:hypothetical protein